MNTLSLDNYGVVEMDANSLMSIQGGNPIIRTVGKWCAEQAAAWGLGKVLDAAYEYLKDNPPSNPPGIGPMGCPGKI